MSSTTITSTPYDDNERESLGSMPEHELDNSALNSDSEFMLEHLLELLSLDSFDDDDDDDADLISSVAHSLMSDQEIIDWQWNISAELDTSLAALHTTRARGPLPAERPTDRTHQLQAMPGPNCWIGLSVGWPQTDVSFERFGMVPWSHTPQISLSPRYSLPRNLQYYRSPLGSLNGIPEYDTGRAATLFYPDSILPLPPL